MNPPSNCSHLILCSSPEELYPFLILIWYIWLLLSFINMDIRSNITCISSSTWSSVSRILYFVIFFFDSRSSNSTNLFQILIICITSFTCYFLFVFFIFFSFIWDCFFILFLLKCLFIIVSLLLFWILWICYIINHVSFSVSTIFCTSLWI